MTIQPEQVEFHPMSQADMNGRLFTWEGELYRGIKPSAEPLYRQLFDRGVVRRLVDRKLLVETEMTDLRIDDYPLVVRHRRLPFASYPYEWCAAMFKAAAIKTIDLQIELTKQGLSMHDAHPYNVIFDGTEPLFIDFTSIIPHPPGHAWAMYQVFFRMFLNPLTLMSRGYGHIARWLLFDTERGVSFGDMAALAGTGRRAIAVRKALRGTAHRMLPSRIRHGLAEKLSEVRVAAAAAMDGAGSLEAIRERLEEIETDEKMDPDADFVADHAEVAPERRIAWRAALEELTRRHHPPTILDLGPDPVQRAEAWHDGGSKVVALSPQPALCAELYRRARSGGRWILPLVMSARAPTPGHGIADCMSVPASRRLKCQAVVAFDLVHRLANYYRLPYESSLEMLADFTEQWLLVEFVPPPRSTDTEAVNALARFQGAMAAHFCGIERLESAAGEQSILLCRKKADAPAKGGEERINARA